MTTRTERINHYRYTVTREDCEAQRNAARRSMKAGREELARSQHEKADEMYEGLHLRLDADADFLRLMR